MPRREFEAEIEIEIKKPDTYEAQNSNVAVITLRHSNEIHHYITNRKKVGQVYTNSLYGYITQSNTKLSLRFTE
ncbi:hypothetical protein [Winogradskyella helgolandensis]|uniref:hypothetical protein n=1 Tax=Winogradskyella helgolandensis TaxID=2697010 RepID=UPI0015B91D6A|nr:hypothetical protein [Winogradskyella helgolandensis]